MARASVLGLFARKAAFLRTPKTSERAKWWQALRANWAESALALLGAAGIAGALSKATQPGGPLLAGLLLFPTLGMAAAPCNSWAARRASLPPWLRERRRTEYRRERRAFAMGAATGGLVTVLCAVITAAVLMFTPHHLVHGPKPIGPTHGSRPSPSPLGKCPTLAEGYHGGCVDQLQTELNADDGDNLPLDGTFGPATQEAVKVFQQKHGIVPAEGIVGPQTKAALDNLGPNSVATPTPGALVAGEVPSS